MKIRNKYFYFRVRAINEGTGFGIEDASDVDVVEVVRCKDCKHMTEHYDTDGNVPYWTCSEWDGGTDYDGYCHYGERKNDDKH